MNDRRPPAVEMSPMSIRGCRAKLGGDRILHRLQPLLGGIAGIRLKQQMTAAGEVQAEVDLSRCGSQAGQRAGKRRSGDQAGNRRAGRRPR